MCNNEITALLLDDGTTLAAADLKKRFYFPPSSISFKSDHNISLFKEEAEVCTHSPHPTHQRIMDFRSQYTTEIRFFFYSPPLFSFAPFSSTQIHPFFSLQNSASLFHKSFDDMLTHSYSFFLFSFPSFSQM